MKMELVVQTGNGKCTMSLIIDSDETAYAVGDLVATYLRQQREAEHVRRDH